MTVTVDLMRLAHGADLALPARATAGAAGVDLVAAASVTLAPQGRHPVPTGIAIALPEGYEAQVRPRSGLAVRHGVTVLNAPGTIDADYRGEIMVVLINLGDRAVEIARGMRIAQLVVAPVTEVAFRQVETLNRTARGSGGLGSTGGIGD